jgi:ribosomal protein S18 acetylase RimI-like enzyme
MDWAMINKQQVIIRRASPTDVEMVTAITDAAYGKYVPRLGRKPQPMMVDYHQVLAEHPVWLLCIDDHPAGVLILIHEPDALLIYSVAVHPRYQQRGFGRQLLAWGEHEARRAGYTLIRLYTNALMEENIALYQRLGYSETRREPYQGLLLVHLEKGLESPMGGA